MARENDLTQGSIPKQLLRYATPLILSSLLQAMYGMVDMIVAGNFIGSSGLSAITNASSVTMMLTNIFIGITTGGNILIGQYYGAREKKNTHDSIVSLFTVCLILGVVVVALVYPLSRPFLELLRAPALDEATVYLQVCSLGMFFVLGYNSTSSALRAVGNSKAPLLCIVITTVLNMILDIIFVGPLNMGTAGAAWATVISQAASFIISLIIVLRSYDIFGLSLKKLYMRREKLRMIFKLGIPCAVQMSIASISWLSVTYLINGYGQFVSAGNGVAAKIKDFCQMFTVAMANAAAGMIAQCIGAKQYDRARSVMYTAMKITLAMAVIIIIVVEFLAPQLVLVFTDDAETAAAAVRNLRIEILGQVFYASFLIYHALALGAGNTWFVFFSSFTNCILARLILAFLLNHFFGLDGIYWACMLAPFVSVPVGLWYERSNRWRRTLIAETH